MSDEKIQVNEHPRKKPDGNYTTVHAHPRTKVQGRGSSPEQQEERDRKRRAMASKIRALSREDTTPNVFVETDRFDKMPHAAQQVAVAIVADVPFLAWGSPGTGKTVMIEQIADAFGLLSETVIAGDSEQSDFSGTPAVIGAPGSESMKRMAPEWAENVEDQDAFVFLDEVNRARPDVQNALLRLVTKRELERKKLGKGVRVGAAANPDDEGIYDITEALRRRFMHIDWEIDTDAQLEHYATRTWKIFSPDLAEKAPSPEELIAGVNRWSNISVGFFNRFKEHMHSRYETSDDESQKGYGFPNKGSWEDSFRLLTIAESFGASEAVKENLVKGCVGDVAGGDFWTYYKHLDLPDPEDLLVNPDSYVPLDKEDQVYIVTNGLVNAVKENPTPERWSQAISVLCRIVKANGDIAAGAFPEFIAMRRQHPELKKASLPKDDMINYQDILTTAGVLRRKTP